MLEQVDKIAAKLQGRGLNPGDRAAILSPSSPACAAFVIACWRAGIVAAPLSGRYPAEKVDAAVSALDCQILVAGEEYARLNFNSNVLPLADFVNPDLSDLPSVFFEELALDIDSDASIVMTSATTSRPKGVLHTIANHYYSALGSQANIVFARGDSWLVCLPMYHISGLSLLMRALVGGGSLVFPRVKGSLNAALVRLKPSHVSLVAAQLSELLEDGPAVETMRNMKAILVGGSAVPRNLVERCLTLGLPVHTTYGSTEAASQVTTTAGADLQTDPGTSGRLLPYRELAIAPDGEILVKGKTLFKGYIVPGGIELPLDANGFFHTRDCGRLDDHGLLFVRGRKDLMFISGGENIYPSEIERAIADVSGVAHAVVVPVDQPPMGKRPVAFVKMQKGRTLDAERLETQLRRRLEGFKIPIAFLPWPADMHNLLKPDRAALSKLAQQMPGRA